MTGRLNPRRYDLGELRDAAREPRRRGGDDPAETHSERADGDRSVPVEPTTNESPTRRALTSAETQDGDEVEAYLRARHQRGREAHTRTEPGRGGDERRQLGRGAHAESSTAAAPRGAPNAAAFLAELSAAGVSKPYLDRLPDAYTAQLEVFEWLEVLFQRADREKAIAALEYYESIGWLSERSREELIDVASGLSVSGPAGGSLGINDHRESLLYVARLAQRRQE